MEMKTVRDNQVNLHYVNRSYKYHSVQSNQTQKFRSACHKLTKGNYPNVLPSTENIL